MKDLIDGNIERVFSFFFFSKCVVSRRILFGFSCCAKNKHTIQPVSHADGEINKCLQRWTGIYDYMVYMVHMYLGMQTTELFFSRAIQVCISSGQSVGLDRIRYA